MRHDGKTSGGEVEEVVVVGQSWQVALVVVMFVRRNVPTLADALVAIHAANEVFVVGHVVAGEVEAARGLES